jgi:hypothetical protein
MSSNSNSRVVGRAHGRNGRMLMMSLVRKGLLSRLSVLGMCIIHLRWRKYGGISLHSSRRGSEIHGLGYVRNPTIFLRSSTVVVVVVAHGACIQTLIIGAIEWPLRLIRDHHLLSTTHYKAKTTLNQTQNSFKKVEFQNLTIILIYTAVRRHRATAASACTVIGLSCR